MCLTEIIAMQKQTHFVYQKYDKLFYDFGLVHPGDILYSNVKL